MKKTMTVILALVMLVMTMACAWSESMYVDNRETDKIYPERLNLRAQPGRRK